MILEKPLLQRKSSAREKHTRLFKWALLSSGIQCRDSQEGLNISQNTVKRPVRQATAF